jgi:hypothetical protein
LAACTAYVTINDPSDGGVFLPCPFRAATGLWCPGCGLTRAAHHLFRGDIAQALRYNVFVVAILATIAASWLGWTLSRAGRPASWARAIPVRLQIGAIAVLLAFAVIRNLPGIHGLRG